VKPNDSAVQANETMCAMGVTRVGPLLRRLRMHLQTERFLARLRPDGVWAGGCDDAMAAIERLEAKMSVREIERLLPPAPSDVVLRPCGAAGRRRRVCPPKTLVRGLFRMRVAALRAAFRVDETRGRARRQASVCLAKGVVR
jgi:hypothetical protein